LLIQCFWDVQVCRLPCIFMCLCACE
jgi:hypothetical protein